MARLGYLGGNGLGMWRRRPATLVAGSRVWGTGKAAAAAAR